MNEVIYELIFRGLRDKYGEAQVIPMYNKLGISYVLDEYRKPERWITVKGHHIPIFKGQTPQQAINNFLTRPIILKDGMAANDYFYNNDSYKQWQNSLTEADKLVLRGYTDTKHLIINKQLRSGNIESITKQYIDILDGIIERFNLERSIKVYRIIKKIPIEKDSQNFTDKGFVSTTTDKNAFPLSEHPLFIINIPAGKGQGAYINKYSLYKNQEYEFLIKRNSKFRIRKKYKENERLIIELDLQ